jgi:hypothetical protein
MAATVRVVAWFCGRAGAELFGVVGTDRIRHGCHALSFCHLVRQSSISMGIQAPNKSFEKRCVGSRGISSMGMADLVVLLFPSH